MDKLKTNYVRKDKLSASGVNHVTDTINEIIDETNKQQGTSMEKLTKTFVDGQPFYAADMNTFSETVNDVIDVLEEGESPDKYVPGDVILFDTVENKKIKSSAKAYNAEKYPLTRYIPIGVVAYDIENQEYIIHDAQGNEITSSAPRAAMVSLMQMTRGEESEYGTPETGTLKYEGIVWGGYEIDATGVFTTESGGVIGQDGTIRDYDGGEQVPSDKFSTSPSLDLQRGYYDECNLTEDGMTDFEDTSKWPSPYLADGSINPVYLQRTFTPEGEEEPYLLVLSDIDGAYNTKTLVGLAQSDDWKTGVIANDSATTGYYPAAFCCQRYITPGTTAGDWYLPAEGEMGFFMANFTAIQNGLNKIRRVLLENQTSGSTPVASVAGLNTDGYYWSSSQYISNGAWGVDTGDGDVYYSNKYSSDYVRAFAALPAL